MNWNQSNNNLFLLHISFWRIKHYGSGLTHSRSWGPGYWIEGFLIIKAHIQNRDYDIFFESLVIDWKACLILTWITKRTIFIDTKSYLLWLVTFIVCVWNWEKRTSLKVCLKISPFTSKSEGRFKCLYYLIIKDMVNSTHFVRFVKHL